MLVTVWYFFFEVRIAILNAQTLLESHFRMFNIGGCSSKLSKVRTFRNAFSFKFSTTESVAISTQQ